MHKIERVEDFGAVTENGDVEEQEGESESSGDGEEGEINMDVTSAQSPEKVSLVEEIGRT